MASTYLSHSASGGSRTTWTISAWVKRSKLSSGTATIFNGYVDGSNESQLLFNNDCIEFYDWTSGSRTGTLFTNRKFRDTSAWYHIVAVWDTTNATAGNRMRLYVNGVEETSFSTDTQPSSSQNSSLGNGSYAQQIGLYGSNANFYFDGLMSYVAFVDGTAELPTIFGETDATTGEWKIKTTITPSAGWGTNGFLVLKDGNTITDQSANSNNFTLGGGTLTNTEDCPSNNFASLNPLHKGTMLTGFTFANGNNTFTAGSTNFPFTCSTIAVSSGKYYAEFKTTANANQIGIGISAGVASAYIGHNQYDYAYYGLNGNIITNQTSNTTYGTGLSTNDILGVALDATNSKLYFSVNGSWQNSANPSSGTGGFSITAPSSTTTGVYHFALGDEASSTPSVQCNFGSGYFGTTAVASANADANGHGAMEYAVPSGYYTLNTKNLKEFG